MDGHNTGVIQGAGCLGFEDETLFAGGIGDSVGRQNLDRYGTIEMIIVSLVNDTHTAFTELGFNAVVVKHPADHASKP